MLHTLRQHLKGDHSIVTVVVVTFLLVNLLLITIDALATIIGIVDDPVVRNRLYFVWLSFQFFTILPIQWISLIQSCRFQIEAFQNYGGAALSIVFAFVLTGVLFQYNFPSLAEAGHYLDIAKGKDHYQSTISVENKVLRLSGSLEFGSAKKVEKAIQAHNIETLELDVTAGQLYEARQIAKLVSDLQMGVLVTSRCLTPCTLILASGRLRQVNRDALVGFQSYKILYPDPRSDWFVEQEQSKDIRWLIDHKVSKSFVYQTFYSRTNQNFWYPELSRLVEVGYIDRINND